MGLTAALAVVQKQVVAAINAAGVQGLGQVVVGWPLGPELVKILTKRNEQYQVSVWPLTSINESRYPQDSVTTEVEPTLVATLAGDVVTFSGAVAAGYNIYAQVRPLTMGALYTTIAGDTLASVAAHVATAIDALQQGATATANGAQVTVVGTSFLIVNVGGTTSTVNTEVSRVQSTVQVTTWAPDPVLRGLIHDAIVDGVGTSDRIFPDPNADVNITYGRESWNDDSQNSYSLYQSLIVFLVEYPILRTASATQIDAILLGIQVGPSGAATLPLSNIGAVDTLAVGII